MFQNTVTFQFLSNPFEPFYSEMNSENHKFSAQFKYAFAVKFEEILIVIAVLSNFSEMHIFWSC